MNGIDISKWQATLDLSAIDADFVIVQASKGLDHENIYWYEQIEKVLELGKQLGVYHYAKTYSWEAEADFFLSSIKPYIGKCAIFLDFEGVAVENGVDWAESWLDYVAKKTGATPGIYMNGAAIKRWGSDWSSVAGKYPLWVARYSAPDDKGYQSNPNLNVSIEPWEKCIVHQYTRYGKLPGYDKDLDLDIFYGTENDWNKLKGGKRMKVEANLTNVNCNQGAMGTVQWIVVHNTANGKSYEGMAYNNTQYFKNVYREASAHYFIDDGDTIWQCVGEDDVAWHIGDSWSRNGATNYNAIGIEVCENEWGEFTENEKNNLRELVLDLMNRYGIDADHVCRHYDVTTKRCPWLYADNDDMWEELHAYITNEEDDMITEEDIEKIADATMWKIVGYKSKWEAEDSPAKGMDIFGLINESYKNSRTIKSNVKNIKVPETNVDYDKLAEKVAAKVSVPATEKIDYDKLATKVCDLIYTRMKN